jgi:hypothetical protein
VKVKRSSVFAEAQRRRILTLWAQNRERLAGAVRMNALKHGVWSAESVAERRALADLLLAARNLTLALEGVRYRPSRSSVSSAQQP